MLAFFYSLHRAHTDVPELPELPRDDQICSFLMITQRMSMRPVPRVNCAFSAFTDVVQSPWYRPHLSACRSPPARGSTLIFKQDLMLELHDPQIKLSLTYFQV